MPLATPTEPAVPMKAAASSSKPLTFGPRITRPLRSTVEDGVLDLVLQLGVLSLDVHESDGHVLRLLAAGEVEPGTYHRPPERATGRRRATVRPRRSRGGVRFAHDRIHHRQRRRVGDAPHRQLGPAGRLRPHAARERLHPGAQRGDHAVRRLRRERRAHDAARHHRGRRRRQPGRLLDRLRHRLLRRPAVRRPLGQVRAAAPAPPRDGAALVRPATALPSCSSAA